MFAESFPDEAIDELVRAFLDTPSPDSSTELWHLGNAMDSDATAFGFREAEFVFDIDAGWEDPTADEANVEWTRRHWEALRPYSMDGSYAGSPGFPGFVEGEERARTTYGENYERLAEIAARDEPENTLRSLVPSESAD